MGSGEVWDFFSGEKTSTSASGVFAIPESGFVPAFSGLLGAVTCDWRQCDII